MGGVRVGTGEFRYEVAQSWGQLPNGWEFGLVSAVAVDSQDRVYVYNRGDHPVIVFDCDGNFVTSWGEGVIVDAHGLCITPDDSVYMVDRDAHLVLKCDLEGRLLLTLGQRDSPSMGHPFNHPADVAVSPVGEIYVADGYGNSRVHKFSAEGKFMLSWGRPGNGQGEFKVPHGIWVDRKGRVYVVDRDNDRVQIFGAEGEFITQWTDFYRPTAVHLDANEAVYVVDHTPRLSIMDPEGRLVARGKVGGIGHGIWADSKGDLYVALVYDRKVEKYVRKAAPPR